MFCGSPMRSSAMREPDILTWPAAPTYPHHLTNPRTCNFTLYQPTLYNTAYIHRTWSVCLWHLFSFGMEDTAEAILEPFIKVEERCANQCRKTRTAWARWRVQLEDNSGLRFRWSVFTILDILASGLGYNKTRSLPGLGILEHRAATLLLLKLTGIAVGDGTCP